MESSSNKKSHQLLYKLFLRGYKSPSSSQLGISPRSVSCNFARTKLSPAEESEQRYKRRQRIPEDNGLEPPAPSSVPVEIVELQEEEEPRQELLESETPAMMMEPRVPSPEPCQEDNKLLDLKWTCATLNKRRDVIADYFQRSILKQRRDYEQQQQESEEDPSSTELLESSLYENYYLFLRNQQGASSPSPEPIYAEICSDSELALHQEQLSPAASTTSSSSASSASSSCNSQEALSHEQDKYPPQGLSIVEELSEEEEDDEDEDDEHLYENIDIIRHEILLRQQQQQQHHHQSFQEDSSAQDSEEEITSAEENGEIDEGSILENKPAIKDYWESKMRENGASKFAQSSFGVPSTTVIDRINDEIREDYLRNLELNHDEGLPRSSASDTSDEPIEFDSFDMASSNGSSPFGQPNDASSPLIPESPTLIDSGHQSHQSNLAESENDVQESLMSLQLETGAGEESGVNNNNQNYNKNYQPGSPIYKGYNNSQSSNNSPSNIQPNRFQSGTRFAPTVGGLNYQGIVEANKKAPGGHGKIENHVTHYIAFNKPFARTVKPIDEPAGAATAAAERERSAPTQEPVEDKFASLSLSKQTEPASFKSVGKTTDVSYMLATSRLKKEIEDNLQREKELKEQGRVKTLSVETVVSPTPAEATSSYEQLRSEPKGPAVEVEKVTIKEEKPKEEVKKPTPVAAANHFVSLPAVKKQETTSTPAPPPASQKPAVAPKKEPLTRRDSFPEGQQLQRQYSSPESQSNFNFPKIGKNFNSLERYIMYSSLTRLNIKSVPPTPTATTTSEDGLSPVANGSQENSNNNAPAFDFDTDAIDSSKQAGLKVSTRFTNTTTGPEDTLPEEDEPVEKVRRKYIPAEKRIQNELLEMIEREEELKRSRQQWKSTPNLSNLTEDEEEEAQVVVPREAPVRVNNEKRRRSALISKWEDMISKNNQ